MLINNRTVFLIPFFWHQPMQTGCNDPSKYTLGKYWTVTYSQRDKFISVRKKGTISFEKGNLFHVIHIILPILRQFRAFGARQRLWKFATKKIADLLSLLYQWRYYIIIFLTVCIYPLTRNSREGKYQNCFNCYFRTWEYIKYIIYLNAEKDSIDHRSYARKARSCESKAWKRIDA